MLNKYEVCLYKLVYVKSKIFNIVNVLREDTQEC